MSNRKTKTSELLLIKYIKITKLFVIDHITRYVQILKFKCYIAAQIDKTN